MSQKRSRLISKAKNLQVKVTRTRATPEVGENIVSQHLLAMAFPHHENTIVMQCNVELDTLYTLLHRLELLIYMSY